MQALLSKYNPIFNISKYGDIFSPDFKPFVQDDCTTVEIKSERLECGYPQFFVNLSDKLTTNISRVLVKQTDMENVKCIHLMVGGQTIISVAADMIDSIQQVLLDGEVYVDVFAPYIQCIPVASIKWHETKIGFEYDEDSCESEMVPTKIGFYQDDFIPGHTTYHDENGNRYQIRDLPMFTYDTPVFYVEVTSGEILTEMEIPLLVPRYINCPELYRSYDFGISSYLLFDKFHDDVSVSLGDDKVSVPQSHMVQWREHALLKTQLSVYIPETVRLKITPQIRCGFVPNVLRVHEGMAGLVYNWH